MNGPWCVLALFHICIFTNAKCITDPQCLSVLFIRLLAPLSVRSFSGTVEPTWTKFGRWLCGTRDPECSISSQNDHSSRSYNYHWFYLSCTPNFCLYLCLLIFCSTKSFLRAVSLQRLTKHTRPPGVFIHLRVCKINIKKWFLHLIWEHCRRLF